MGINIQKVMRVTIPVFACFLILFVSASPAYAAFAPGYDGIISAGDYAIVEQPQKPSEMFAVSISFADEYGSYSIIIFRPAGTQTIMQYDALYFNDDLICYWIDDSCYWVSRNSAYITLKQDFVASETGSSNVFYWWFLQNTAKLSPPPAGDDVQDQIKDGLASGWESIQDHYQGNLMPDDFGSFSACLAVFWDSPLIMRIMTFSVAFLLVGFVVFGESKHG